MAKKKASPKSSKKGIETKNKNPVNQEECFKFNLLSLGVAGGVIGGLFVLFASLSALMNAAPTFVSIIKEIYGPFGYAPENILKSVLGIIYGFIDGFIVAVIFGWIYNKISHI